MALFATALDNTLIFSKGFVKNEDVIAVEYKDNKELSYMTKQALDTLKSLNEEITIVPITSRSLEEFKQLTFYNLFEHAILSNGLVILYKGLVEDGNWQSIIQKEFDKMDKSKAKYFSLWEDEPSLKFLEKEMDSEYIDKFSEIYVVASDWSWTYMKTHEEECGPYFYRP